MNVSTTDELAALMNRRVQVGESTSFIVSYLDRASLQRHDTVLRKFSIIFFAGLHASILLSCNARTSESQKAGFSKHLDDCDEYYESQKCTAAWQRATHTV